MKATALGFLFASISLSGCAYIPLQGFKKPTVVPLDREAVFVASEYAPYQGEGNSTITGLAFIRNHGDVSYGAGIEILLTPVTSYSNEWFNKSILHGKTMKMGDPRSTTFSRTTISDSVGRFRFERLKPGEYYVTCQVTGAKPGTYSDVGGMIGAGRPFKRRAYAITRVGDGEMVSVTLTR